MTGIDVTATDGTRLRAWRADAAAGTPVLISNGLGSPPDAWPAILDPRSGFRALTWYHRGLGGSERPRDTTNIRVEDHARDLGAVLDAAGVDRVLVVGWSVGVPVAFEFATQQPDRVAGILAVAGVPGGSLRGMFGSVGVPRALRESTGRLSTQMLRITGPWLSSLAAAIPMSHRPVSASGAAAVFREVSHAGSLMAVLRGFAAHDWEWYSRLVFAAATAPSPDLSAVHIPVTLLAGLHDTVTSSDDVTATARALPDARVRVFPAGTHFLPLQYPDAMLTELRLLSERAGIVRTG